MRILCASDTHGRVYPLINAIDMLSPDAVLFAGDGAREVENIADDYDIPFYIVKGNCDLGFYHPEQVLNFAGKTILLTHGHEHGVKQDITRLENYARAISADIVVYGHTHHAKQHYDDGLYLLNPGSIGHPDNGKPSCGYIDIVGGSVIMNIVNLD